MNKSIFNAALAAVFSLASSAAMAGDLDGAYVGASGHMGLNAPVTPDLEIGAFAGYNYGLSGGMVVGGEADIAYNNDSLWGPNAVTTKLNARAGYEISDNVLLYGKAGVGYTTGGAGSMVWGVGAGVDIAVMDNVLLRTEGERVDPTAGGMMTQYNAKVGVGYSF